MRGAGQCAFPRRNRLRYMPYRIAEDVGFYLCALACCERMAMLDQPVFDYRVYDGSSVQRVTLKVLDCISVFDETEAFYRARGMGNAFYGELLYDRLFHYLLWMERLPRLGTKEERRQMEAAFEQSRRALDFSAAQIKPMKEISSAQHVMPKRPGTKQPLGTRGV